MLAIYADRLQRRGHAVTVISLPQPRISLSQKIKSLLRGKSWPKAPEPGSHFDNIDVPHHILESVRPVSDKDVPDSDIVLATFWKTGQWVNDLSSHKGAKAILLQGYETSPGMENPAIDFAWRLPLKKIVISKWMVDMARDRFGDTDVYLVPNSVETEKFHAPARSMQKIPTVGMLYSSLHLKGTDVSLTALSQVRKTIKNLRVIAFGAEQVSSELPLPEWVEFHYRPPQDEIPLLYSQCDVWLCGSRREGFGLPLLEAMACRCPVISTRCGGPLDFVEDGINGFLVDVDDSSTLAKRLIHALTQSDVEWQRMSDAAFIKATSYTWDDATNLLEEALRDVIAKQMIKRVIYQ